jgi:hypothetical protein
MRIQIILHHNHPTDSLRLLFRLFPLKALPTLVPAQKTSSTVPATPLHYSKIHAISPTPKFEIELLQVNLQTAQSTEVRNPLTLLCIFQTGSITLEPPGHFRATSSNKPQNKRLQSCSAMNRQRTRSRVQIGQNKLTSQRMRRGQQAGSVRKPDLCKHCAGREDGTGLAGTRPC